MIRSFKSKETEKIFSRQKSPLFPEEVQRIALRELRLLDQSAAANASWIALNQNGKQLPAGDVGRYAIAFHDGWRISFEWRDGNVYNVDVSKGGAS